MTNLQDAVKEATYSFEEPRSEGPNRFLLAQANELCPAYQRAFTTVQDAAPNIRIHWPKHV